MPWACRRPRWALLAPAVALMLLGLAYLAYRESPGNGVLRSSPPPWL